MGEPKFGVFIEYPSMAEADRAAEGLRRLLPDKVVSVLALDRSSNGRVNQDLRKTPISAMVRHDGSVSRAVRNWFKTERNEPRYGPRDFTIADLLEVPLSFLERQPYITKRTLSFLKRFLEEYELELKG